MRKTKKTLQTSVPYQCSLLPRIDTPGQPGGPTAQPSCTSGSTCSKKAAKISRHRRRVTRLITALGKPHPPEHLVTEVLRILLEEKCDVMIFGSRACAVQGWNGFRDHVRELEAAGFDLSDPPGFIRWSRV